MDDGAERADEKDIGVAAACLCSLFRAWEGVANAEVFANHQLLDLRRRAHSRDDPEVSRDHACQVERSGGEAGTELLRLAHIVERVFEQRLRFMFPVPGNPL